MEAKTFCFLLIYLLIYFTANSKISCNPIEGSIFPKVSGTKNAYIFQGDMVFTKEQIEAALTGKDTDAAEESMYGLQNSKWFRWPNCIVPYDLTGIKNRPLGIVGLKGFTEKAVRAAMAEWENKTCIRFVERTNEKDYLNFIKGGYGKCYSFVGRSGGKQDISLGFECFFKGIAIHEIGHALGLHHEQSRPDRDDYVEIVWSNIKEAYKPQFKKYSHKFINSLGSPYDYDSIMHYRRSAFAKIPFTSTIRAKKPGVSIGQRSYISDQDAWQINKYYECDKNKGK